MPNWKKVIVSGSDASLNSLNVNTYISASSFSGKFTGSLQGSSSYALTASYVQNAQTASYVVSASYAVTASNAITASYALYAASAPNIGTTTTFTQATSASTWTFIHNLNTYTPQITVYDYGKNVIIPQNIAGTGANTVTINFNASQSGYAVISNGGGLVITGSSYYFTQASASSTWLIEHPLNTRTPIVQVYDPAYTSILTEYITALSNTLVSVTLPTSTTGFAVLSNGGNLFISGSSARLTQSIAAVTWSFTHSLNTKYPVVQVYDANDSVIIPSTVRAIDTNTTQITFATPTSGVAVAEFSGINGLQDNTVSSSYAATASSADNFIVRNGFTASGLNYPSIDNGEKSFIQTDGNGNLSLQYVDTIFEAFYAAESVSKGTPLYFSGSQGANPKAYAADASDSNKMPVIVVANDNLTAGTVYEGIVLGLIEGIDLTGYTAGQTVYVAEGGGWTTSLPSGSNSITQVLGIVTKGGNGGKGLVLNPGPAQLPGLQTGYVWVGNGNNQPIAVTTSSIRNVISSSYAQTAPAYTLTSSFLAFTSSVNATTGALNTTTGALNVTTGALNTTTGSLNAFSGAINLFTASVNSTTGALNSKTGSYATTGSNTFIGNQTITGNGTVTGDWTVQGNLIAQTFILSSSVSYFTQSFSSGSTKFGDHSFDTHQFTGSVRITGSLDITGSVTSTYGFTGSLFGTSSWAQNAVVAPYYVLTSSFSTTSASISTRVTNLESTASAFVVASASFSSSIVTLTNASASLATNSGSNSTRFTLLESTASVLTTASASFSSSIVTLTNASTSFAAVSTSYSTASGSLSSRVTVLETASGSLSASVATLIKASASLAINSGSNSTRFTTLENASASFTSQSGSNSTRLTVLENASASFATNSGSNSTRFTVLENASASFATNSGSNSTRLTLLEGTASIFATTSASIVANYIKNSQTSSMTVLSSSFALTASYVASIANLSTTQIATGSVTASVSGSDATFRVVSGSNTFLFVSSSGLTTVSGTFAVNVNNVNEFLISSTGSSLGNALTDIHSITGSLRVTGSITGSMFGTSSFAVSSSNALTASSVNPLNQTVSINGGLTVTGSTILSGSAGVTVLSANVDTIVFSGSFTSTGSVTITGSVNVLGGVTGSLLGTASYAVQGLSSSYAITASYALNSTVNAFTHTQAASASTWTINHALNSRNLNVTVYDFGYNVIIPQNISNTDGNTSIVTFPSAQSGYAVLNPGGLLVTGSTAVFSASSAAVTWSFTHSLNTRVVNLDVYDASYNQVIPSRVTLTGLNTAEITFATATSGYAIASVNGNSGSVISSQNLVLTSDATNTTRYMTFAASESGVTALFTDPNITLNPSTNTLTVGSLTETSTIELKQNIKNFVTPLAKFMALKPVSYKWKANKRKDIGFIAEQVQEIFPEIVAEDGKSMSYTKLTPILIDMVQRQQKMIEDMNQEIKELKKHINRT